MLRRLSFDERSARLRFIERKHELNPTFHDPVSFLQITLTSHRYNVTFIILVEEFEIHRPCFGLQVSCIKYVGRVLEQLDVVLDLWDSLSFSGENDFHLCFVVSGVVSDLD